MSPHLKVNMALSFFKTTNSAGLGIIVDGHSSLIIVHTELIPCQGDPLWMATDCHDLLRALHFYHELGKFANS